MQKIVLRARVGRDGILHLDVPVTIHDADLEVTVTIQPVTSEAKKSPQELGYQADFFERTFGSLRDEPLEREPQGELQEREPLG
jgi:hypothetical protein